jgi:hypothetical protein
MIGEINIHNKSQSGGAFLLEDAPKEEFDIQLSDGWRVTVKESEPYVVIQSESNYNKNKVFDETYDAAVRGLDIASIDQVRGLNTQMAERHHILWWTKNNNEFIQITGIATGFDRARDTVQVGNQVSEPHIPDWHESFRYYRLSLISEEPFDVYRNLFLAFESLLSDIQKKTQSHREWIEQGLEEFQRRHGKDPIEGTGSWGGEEYDSVEEFAEEHWTNTRNRMFHAKKGSNNLNPEVANDVQSVRKRIRELSEVYSNLVSSKFGRSLGTGGVNAHAFESMVDWMDDGNTRCAIFSGVPDWNFNSNLQDTTLERDLFEIECSFEEKFMKNVISETEISELARIPIRHFVLANSDSDFMLHPPTPKTDIDPSDFDYLRIQIGHQYAPGSRSRIW